MQSFRTKPPAPQLQVPLVARRNLNPRQGQLIEALCAVSHSFVPALARICKPFRNRRPQSASNDPDAGEPTPILRGRLRCAAVGAGLSRRRPRVRVPSTPPTILQRINGFRSLAGACLQTGRSPRSWACLQDEGIGCHPTPISPCFGATDCREIRDFRSGGFGTPRPPAQMAAGRGNEKFEVGRRGRRG